MNHPDVADGPVRIEHGHNLFNGWNRTVTLVDLEVGPSDALENLRRPVPIGTIGNNQRLAALVRAQAAQRCFNAKGSGSLHDHAFIAAVTISQLQNALADIANDFPELHVARAPVSQHDVLHRARCRKRAWRKKIGHVFLALGPRKRWFIGRCLGIHSGLRMGGAQ